MNWNAKKEWNNLVESYRIIEEAATVDEWEDLHNVIDMALQRKKIAQEYEAGGEAAGKLAKGVIGTIPFLGNAWNAAGGVKDVAELAFKLMDMGDEQVEASEIMGSLKIDPGYAEILDNKLETEFLKWFKNWIGGRTGPIGPDESSINKVLELFLTERGTHDETVKDGDSAAKFTDIPYPDDDLDVEKLKKGGWNFLKNII